MRIAIEATLAQGPQTGLGQYVRNLLAGLATVAPENRYFLLHATRAWTGPDLGPAFEPVSYACGKQSLAIRCRLNAVLRQTGAEIFHATGTTGLPPRPAVPAIATVHDLYPLIAPGNCRLAHRLFFRLLWHWTRTGASHFITDSEFVAGELRRMAGIPAERITSIPLAPDPETPAPAGPASAPKHLLCLGAIEPRKGQIFLARTYANLLLQGEHLPDLRFAGPDRGDGRQLARLLRGPPLLGRATWSGPVPSSTRDQLYRDAYALVFPSFYEGFGLPVLEAMARGTPVICTDIPVLREVAADAALMPPPGDEAAWGRALHLVLTEPGCRARLVQAGLARVRAFSWESCARRTLACYQRLLSGSRES